MSKIKAKSYRGGAGLAPGTGSADSPELALTLRDVADDLAELRTQLIALMAKLDADSGVGDTDYESVLTPAALKTTKG